MQLAAEADDVRQQARKAGEAERTALINQAQDQIAKARQAADTQAEQKRAQMQQDLERDAHRLAVVIASHLLVRFSQQAAAGTLLHAPTAWLDNLSECDFRNLVGGSDTLELATAVAPSPDEQAVYRQILRERLKQEVNLQFVTAPELIAGLELRGQYGRIRNNWRADLDRIVEELSRNDRDLAVA